MASSSPYGPLGRHWPQELITLFVNELAGESYRAKKSLQACMLVSKIFYLPARKHLFANIRIVVYPILNNSIAGNKLYAVLKANQALIAEIRSFTVVLDTTVDLEATFYLGRSATKRPGPPSSIKDKAFSRIVDLLLASRLHTLSVDAPTPIELSTLDEEWLGQLIALRCIPSIRTLNLRHIRLPPRALVIGNPESDMLQHLSARNVFFMHPTEQRRIDARRSTRNRPTFVGVKPILDAARTTPLPPLSHLQSLSLHTTNHFLRFVKSCERTDPFPSLSLPGLKSLIWSDEYHDRADEIGSLMLTAPSLETLEVGRLHYPAPAGFPLKVLDFVRFRNLRHIALRGIDKRNTCASDAGTLFANVNSPVDLQTITIIIAEDKAQPLLAMQKWSIIDDALSGPHFTALRTVNVELRYRCRTGRPLRPKGKVEVGDDEARVASLFPRLSSSEQIFLRVTIK